MNKEQKGRKKKEIKMKKVNKRYVKNIKKDKK